MQKKNKTKTRTTKKLQQKKGLYNLVQCILQIGQLYSNTEISMLARKSTTVIALIIELKLIIADFLMLKSNVLMTLYCITTILSSQTSTVTCTFTFLFVRKFEMNVNSSIDLFFSRTP
jgi:Cdc6-like AAA superfamily ATPase